MQTQAVVVYTPLEHALYNSGMLFPLIIGMLVGIFVFLGLMKLAEMILGYRRMSDLVIGGAGVTAVISGGLAFHWMMI